MSKNYGMTAEVAEAKKELSEQDKELLIKGIRPEWMDYNMYRSFRKNMQSGLKHYLRGKLIYNSVNLVEKEDPSKLISSDTKSSNIVRITNKPYVKSDKEEVGTVDAETEGISN